MAIATAPIEKSWRDLESSEAQFIASVFFAAPFHDRECLRVEAAFVKLADTVQGGLELTKDERYELRGSIEDYRPEVTRLLAVIAPATAKRAQMLGRILPFAPVGHDTLGATTEEVMAVLRPIFEEAGIADRLVADKRELEASA